MYKRGMTKEKFTGKMRYFWTTHWKYGTVDTWVKLTMDKVHIDNPDTNLWRNKTFDIEVNNAFQLIDYAIDKLVLEKLLKKDQAKRIREMLKSPDEENHYLAISIMASVKPKKFKQVITQNPETKDEDD